MSALVRELREGLEARADPERARATQAYLKTDLPMLGVSRPLQKALFREVLARHRPQSAAEWEAAVREAWAGPERELRYAAIAIARGWRGAYVDLAAVPLLEQLVREGAWWDLVDEIATHPVGTVLLRHRPEMTAVLRRWIEDPDLWVRRAALLAQVGQGDQADAALLFDLCARQAADRSFWIRKAIGWALRDHARTDPDAVRAFLEAQGPALSGLSRREAGKHLGIR